MNTKLLKKVLASTLALSMILPIGVVNADKQNTQQKAKSQQTTRISGKDRITTSVEISKSAYTTSENVVLASGFNFADALSAGQLASALDAPLLLSSQDKLDSQTKNEIKRLKAKKVFVVGGDNAISKTGIDTTLKSENIDVTRLEGKDRYSTSQKVMEKTKEIINPEYLLIASGKNFPDALAATGFFVNHKSVMVLSDGITYPQSNLQEIAIGGVNQLPLKGFKGKRVSGKDRYETALEIAKLSFDKNNNAILASGQVFADSLSAVSLTKKHNAPIILTQSNSLTENAKKYLNDKNVFIVGGEKTVAKNILTNITSEQRAKIAEEIRQQEKDNKNPSRKKAKENLDKAEKKLKDSKEELENLKAELKKHQEDPETKKKLEEDIKKLEDEEKEFEEKNKAAIEEANKKIAEIDKALPKIDATINEGAFAFFKWAGEKYPEYKQDTENGLAILNEYLQKGDVKKAPEDATSYENMIMTADWLEQLNSLRLKDEHFTGLTKLDTNFEILAKAMVSCNRSLDYTKGHRHTFRVWENLHWGVTNPFKGWYDDEKLVYEELMNTINTKYSTEPTESAMEKAKADFMIKHNGKKPVIGHYTNILSNSISVVAVTKNSSQNGYFRNTFCMNGDFGIRYSTFIKEEKYREIINEYKKVTDKKALLEEKEKAEKTLKDIEEIKADRKNKIENLKKGDDEKTLEINEKIKTKESELELAQNQYEKAKQTYEKLK
ncbi:cell wall-binding repeat-containing protein [Finegoldia magna]|uniref:cell wall-binding repeat-containing protein n=1 Tax=Finegoldia magna TaxID=1260 RepID=UPI0026EC1B7A|nr:cell wall-binding repeat-containing protein [Finegoldia magna]